MGASHCAIREDNWQAVEHGRPLQGNRVQRSSRALVAGCSGGAGGQSRARSLRDERKQRAPVAWVAEGVAGHPCPSPVCAIRGHCRAGNLTPWRGHGPGVPRHRPWGLCAASEGGLRTTVQAPWYRCPLPAGRDVHLLPALARHDPPAADRGRGRPWGPCPGSPARAGSDGCS